MEVTFYVLVVAIYTTFPHMHTKPHDYGIFMDEARCKTAGEHFESRQPEKHDRYVAICIPRKMEIKAPLVTG